MPKRDNKRRSLIELKVFIVSIKPCKTDANQSLKISYRIERS